MDPEGKDGQPLESSPDGALKRRGRPPGAKNKSKAPPPERVRLRDVVSRTFSAEQLEKILKRLSPDQAARLLASIEPKERQAEDRGPALLLISGLADGVVCYRCGWIAGTDPAPDVRDWFDRLTPEEVERFRQDSSKAALESRRTRTGGNGEGVPASSPRLLPGPPKDSFRMAPPAAKAWRDGKDGDDGEGGIQ